MKNYDDCDKKTVFKIFLEIGPLSLQLISGDFPFLVIFLAPLEAEIPLFQKETLSAMFLRHHFLSLGLDALVFVWIALSSGVLEGEVVLGQNASQQLNKQAVSQLEISAKTFFGKSHQCCHGSYGNNFGLMMQRLHAHPMAIQFLSVDRCHILYHITGRTPDLQCIFGNHLKLGLSRPEAQVCGSNTDTSGL